MSEIPDLDKLPDVFNECLISGNPSKAGRIDGECCRTPGSITTADSVDSDDDVDDNEEDGDEEIIQPDDVLCFFCDIPAKSPQSILDHCIKDHDCHLAEWVRKRALSTEDIIKMINYIRKEHPSPSMFSSSGTISSVLWSSENYMFPVYAQDHGITSLLIWDWDTVDEDVAEPFPAPCHKNITSDGISRLMTGEDANHEVENCHSDDVRNADYFDSYSGFSIHCEMLRDKVRTEAYREAIGKVVNSNKLVLDIGCGSGVLSCFAAAAGGKVIAVDKADIINYAHDIARVNNLADKINFIHGDLDRLELCLFEASVNKVDVIISEWMDSVISARDKYLAKDGTMIPSNASLHLAAISDDEDWQSTIGFWSDAYGLKFDCLQQYNLLHPSVHVVDPKSMIASTVLRKFDLMTCTVQDLDFSTETTFIPSKSCNITALVGFFDVGYQETENKTQGQQTIMFSTSPNDPHTHWAQSVFYLDKPFQVQQGKAVSLKANIKKTFNDKRGLSVTFHMKDHESLEWQWQQFYEL